MSRKRWQVRQYDKNRVAEIAETLNISPYAALLASARNINDTKTAREFFGMAEPAAADPMSFPDMEKAVTRIRAALDNFERIAVYGDYDADGVTAVALLYSYLELQGADAVYYVPDRHTQGYGLNFGSVDEICRMGAKLIITVDNGISAVDEAKYIKELEMDLIITDHHLPSETLPEAVAVVDPHLDTAGLSFRDYAGVGVAYKLICALEGGENETTDSFLDLAAIGTIADVMPLRNENREIVRRGLELINDPDRAGLRALRDVAGLEERYISSTTASFGIAPRLNAAGRMGSAERAVRLLLTDDYDEAHELAAEINDDNIRRQATEKEIFELASARIESAEDMKYSRVLVVEGEGWHDGVIGIVASRLVEKYGRPAIVITVAGDKAKGSGRSIEGFNLYDALCACADVLTHHGGHMLAAGLGVETSMIDEFRKRINSYAAGMQTPVPVQYIDFKINPASAGTAILDAIDMLEPFGTSNPQPVFGLYDMEITDIRPVGGGKHLRLTLKRDTAVLAALLFRTAQVDFAYTAGDRVDIAAVFERNEYLGQTRLSIIIRNIKPHGVNDDVLFERMDEFSALMRSEFERFGRENTLPDRELIAGVYKLIRSRGVWRFDNEMLCFRLGRPAEDYAKVSVAVEALLQLGTLTRDDEGNLTLPENPVRVNLDDAPVLIKIKTGTR